MDALNVTLSVNLSTIVSWPLRLAKLRFADAGSALARFSLDNYSLSRMEKQSAPPPPRSSLETAYSAHPFAFTTSGYGIGLLTMTILLNRISHVVAPARYPGLQSPTRLSAAERHNLPLWSRLYRSLIPLDLSSPSSRLAFRGISLYALHKSLIIWSILVLQAFNLFPATAFLEPLGSWVASKQMEDVCWSTFGAVCCALIIAALTRGLEGDTGSSSTFNLCGYALILHVYSSPAAHEFVAEDLMTRPDKHVLIIMLLPLLNLTISHTMGIYRRYSAMRLVPSFFTTILAQAHFHSLIWSPATAKSYPIVAYIPNAFDAFLIGVILITNALRVVCQFLLVGNISWGLGSIYRGVEPVWDEDFSMLLLRLGTASLETTKAAGLGNEVAPLSTSQRQKLIEDGALHLSRYGVSKIIPSSRKRRGLINEIKNVKITTTNPDDPFRTARWYHELWKFIVGVCALAIWIFSRLWSLIKYGPQRSEMQDVVTVARTMRRKRRRADETYRRFLRDETISDDDREDDEFYPSSNSEPSVLLSDSESESFLSDMSEDAEYEAPEKYRETALLLADLAEGRFEVPSPSTNVILAHMTDLGSSPLTRRRYSRLSECSATPFQVDHIPTPSHSASPIEPHCCVICTVEPRQIICWPCRCLALCDNCRDNLSSRSPSSKHSCPCCRRSVEGYSRIYIP